MISAFVCAISVTCTLVKEFDPPFRYIGRPYDTARACYIRGKFFKRCPQVHPVPIAPPVIAPTFIFYDKG